MRVIFKARLHEFWERSDRADAEGPLRAWYTHVNHKTISWNSWGDVKAVFGNASIVGNCIVFNIGGNKYRLVTRILYPSQKVFILKVMTHAEYDENKWKDECGCFASPPRARQQTGRLKPIKRKWKGKWRMATKSQFRLQGRSRDSYMDLVRRFPLASIQSDEHLAEAQAVIDRLLVTGALDKGEAIYLDALSDLVASYEDIHHGIEPAGDSDMLRHLIDAHGLTQAQVSRQTGLAKSSISEVLAGKKPLSRRMIRELAKYFQVDAGILAGNL